MSNSDVRIVRMKECLLAARYEICLARALHFTESYRETEGVEPSLRNAMALKRTLEKQAIHIDEDEFLAGSKTEKYLAGPLPVERGDFLRGLQLEMDVLDRKKRPFYITDEDRKVYWNIVVPYWKGRTLRDAKVQNWKATGVLPGLKTFGDRAAVWANGFRATRALGLKGARKVLGVNLGGPWRWRRIKNLYGMRHELSYNNPTPAIFCFDVQGHLCLGVDKVIRLGMNALIQQARDRAAETCKPRQQAFLEAVIMSLEAAVQYAKRFAALAEDTKDKEEQRRLALIAEHCRRVPAEAPRTFHEALQAAWFTVLIAEIQYGMMDVLAIGRADQYLYPLFRQDMDSGRLTKDQAVALLQEFFLKLSANVTPVPELGMESNSVLGNSEHVLTIGGTDADGNDAVNELSWLMLEAFERMGGSANQIAVRIAPNSPPAFLRRAAEVLRTTSGLAFFNDRAIVDGLSADGLTAQDARDYCIVGCVEPTGQSNTFGCLGGHEIVLPAVLSFALTRGRVPAPFPGQTAGLDTGDPHGFRAFEDLVSAFREQLKHQIKILVSAAAGKDCAYRDMLPAPYVSAFVDDCIEKARDLTDGGARYDFTTIAARGLATTVDSLLAVKSFVYDRKELAIEELLYAVSTDFAKHKALRQRLIREAPKFGNGDAEADDMAVRVTGWFNNEVSQYHNVRGGKFRTAFFSYGNHVIDGCLLGATPDGRLRGEPISNGASPSNLFEPKAGPAGPLRALAQFPPAQISSGVSLNMRFHPGFIESECGLDTFASMIATYFEMGGMHLQPNVVSSEVLRKAQADPARYKDLVVKVSGYSAYFCDLGQSIQEDIIARAEFGG